MAEFPNFTRRDFIQLITAAGLVASVEQFSGAAETKDVPYRVLGHTGEKVSIIGIGGYHQGMPGTQQESTRIVRTAVDGGINFMDNCWDYHDGLSEERMGNALRDGYRQRAFLMSKIDSHSKQGAARQIDDSLRRLQTDHVDLMQFHEVIRPDDPEKIFARGGSMEAMLEAKKVGKVRYIGFTGHKNPDIHNHMLDVAAQHNFKFDTVQMPLNCFDAHFESFQHKVLPRLVKENIGVLGMKPMASGLLLQSKAVQPDECLHYALSLPTSVVITGCENVKDVEQALRIARAFKPMSKAQMAALEDRTKSVAATGAWEKYKTEHMFDGTINSPQWLA
jgi:predicted aldo/keto reductase-like oxidoreductase